MTSHEMHTLAGAYALHALPEDEERFFEAHLKACPACRAEVAELRSTAAALGAAAAAPAPPTLRSSVLDAIEVTRQETGPVVTDAPGRRRFALLATAAVFVFIAGALGVSTARLSSQLDELRAQSAEVAAVLSAADAETIPVTGEAGERGRIITSPQRGTTVFVAQDLPAVPDDKTLELWLIDERGARSAGVFRPDDGGRAVHVLPRDLVGVDAVGVTVEPAGGSAQPTTDPFLLADV